MGAAWPAQPKPNVHPKPRPVGTLRPTRCLLQVSTNGGRWLNVAEVAGHSNRTTDRLRFPRVTVRFIRARIIRGTGILVKETINNKTQVVTQMPMLDELTAGR